MTYELFGISPIGGVEFLGTFGKEEQVLRAMDQYEGIGYRRLKFCSWVER